jgi:hypothetical protein
MGGEIAGKKKKAGMGQTPANPTMTPNRPAGTIDDSGEKLVRPISETEPPRLPKTTATPQALKITIADAGWIIHSLVPSSCIWQSLTLKMQ